jgi:hypothetical protein
VLALLEGLQLVAEVVDLNLLADDRPEARQPRDRVLHLRRRHPQDE